MAALQRAWNKSGTPPVTLGLMIAYVISFLATFFAPSLISQFAFSPSQFLHTPNLSPILYPYFLGPQIFNALLTLLSLWSFGSAIESFCGSKLYAQLWFGTALIAVIVTSLTDSLFHYGGWLLYPSIPMEAVIIYWALKNPKQTVLFFMFPLAAWVLAVMGACFVFFTLGYNNPLNGLFALVPLGLVALYARGGLPTRSKVRATGGRYALPTDVTERDFYADAERRKKEREEKERLRKIFEASLIDDPENPD